MSVHPKGAAVFRLRAQELFALVFMVLTGLMARGDTLQIAGHMLVVGPGSQGHSGASDYLFTAELEGNSWKIVTAPAKPGGNGPERAEIATDGNSFYKLSVFPPKEQAVGIERLRVRGEARPGPWLGGCNTPEKMIWLAYCSGGYFLQNTSNAIPDLERVDFRTAPTRPCTASLTQGPIRFLKEFNVYAETPSRSEDKSDKALLEFEVSQWKDLNGCRIPMQCSVAWFSAAQKGTKRERGYTYEISATNCLTKPSLSSFQPILADTAWIVERRFTNPATGSPLTYIETNHVWLTGKESPSSDEVVSRSKRVVFSR